MNREAAYLLNELANSKISVHGWSICESAAKYLLELRQGSHYTVHQWGFDYESNS